MPGSNDLPAEKLDSTHRLWDKLPGFGASRADDALLHALTELAALVDAQQAFWLGVVHMSDRSDALNGWRSAAIRYLHPRPELDKRYATHMKRLRAGKVDPSMLGAHAGKGRFRINIQNEYCPPEWYESEFHAVFIAPLGIQDVIYMITPVGEDIESWFGFQRIGIDKPSYTPADRAIMEYAGRPLGWLHRQICLHHGIKLADSPLTVAERRLLNLLLGDRTESDIARELGLSPTTVHTYATRLYRKLNVKGRAGLMALWLGYRK